MSNKIWPCCCKKKNKKSETSLWIPCRLQTWFKHGQQCSGHFLCGLPAQSLAAFQHTVPRISPVKLNRSPTPRWVTHYSLQLPTEEREEQKKKKTQSQDLKLNRIWLKYNILLSALTIASLMAPHLTTASQEISSVTITLPPPTPIFFKNL